MIKILIADDEPRTRKGLSNIISESALQVEIVGIATNGAEALEKTRLLFPDIIITDIRMPKMDGILFSSEVRKFHPACQIIFISSYSDKEYLRSAISLKVVNYVEKPFEPSEMIDAIQTAIDNINENKRNTNILEQNRTLYQEHRDILREKLALDLANPNMGKTYWEKMYSLFPEFIRTPYFCTVICQISSKKGGKKFPDEPCSQIPEITAHLFPNSLIVQKTPCIFLIYLCGYAPNHSAAMRNMVKDIYTGLQQLFYPQAEIFLAVGSPAANPHQICQSYMDAVICLKKLFFVGYNHICYYKEQDNEMGRPFKPERSLFQDFSAALKQDDSRKATALINQLFQDLQNTLYKFEINSIKDIYYQLLAELKAICKERGMSAVFQYENEFIWETITQADTLFALHYYLHSKLTLFIQESTNKTGFSLLTYRIQQYIELHYRDPNLSINQMAETLHFTPSYLCQIFKSETGATINAYINTFRISKAIDLLKENSIKVYEVAFQVGYNDPNYFSRLFKKQVGMTLTEFREKYFL